jgi:hypothetical protein
MSTTGKMKIPVALSIADYKKELDNYKRGIECDPFSEDLPKFITGSKDWFLLEEHDAPEWWKERNENHAANGRFPFREFFFKSRIENRRKGNYWKGFTSYARTFDEAREGLRIAMGWDKESDRQLIDIEYNEYKRLRK